MLFTIALLWVTTTTNASRRPVPHVLLLKPASYDPEANRQSLTLFADQVQPAAIGFAQRAVEGKSGP
jgi:hypothetical protein